MVNTDIYRDIASRTNGAIMLGVVGPVRTGKSTFIKRFMETLVIPHISDMYMRERAKDELPQSGSGRSIMTSEPKFVPEDAVKIELQEGNAFAVRLVDCVGYMVNGASGQFENGSERLVTTPWFDHEVTMPEAAETGTYKVITEHSTIGLVITTDGSICDIPREDYTEPEERVINELKGIGKPFAVLINSADPESERAIELEEELNEKYAVPCRRVNCQKLSEDEIAEIMGMVLGEFPVSELAFRLPSWVEALGCGCGINEELYGILLKEKDGLRRISDIENLLDGLNASDIVNKAVKSASDMGSGTVNIDIDIPKSLYYGLIKDETSFDINDDGDIITVLREMSEVRKEYDRIKQALSDVRERGYGIIRPTSEDMEFEEPKIVKQGGRYAVKLKAKAPAIHLFKTAVEAEVRPQLGGEGASEEILSFLLQGYEGDMTKLWESNIFGKPLYELAEEGIDDKLRNIPENARAKLQDTLQRIINEGGGTLFCILL